MNESIEEAYTRMYEGMINKDEKILREVLDDDFVLVHMTGLRQNRDVFIHSVLNGTLNYYSARHDDLKVEVQSEDKALLIGKTYVLAAVFGGGKNYWHLRQDCQMARRDGEWKIILSEASTY